MFPLDQGPKLVKKELLRFILYATIIGTLTPAFVGVGASDVPFADVPFDVNNIPEPVPPPPAVVDFFRLSDFWQQWINIEGFPILASAKVSPYATKELAWQIGQMFRGQTDFLKELAKIGETFTLIGHDEVMGDIPEMQHLSLLFFHNVRSRGGWNPRRGSSVEQVFLTASVPVHELAHDIHLFILNRIDSTFDNRLKALYNTVVAKGLWYGAASDYLEYWAEGVTVWFHVPQLSPLKTREALKAYDPDLALLIAEIFGDNDWRYTPIRDRLHLPHLQGFDPESIPWVEFPPGVEEAYEELRDPAINERSEWVNLPPYDPSLLPRLNELRNRSQADRYSVGWTDMLVVNTIDAEIRFYWVNPDGSETLRYRAPPKAYAIAHFSCRVGDLFLAKDTAGRPLAVFQAVEKAGRVLVAPTLHLIKPGLSKVSGDNQAGISGTILGSPFVVEVRDESLSVLEGIVVTFTVTIGDGTLSIIRTTTDENGRAESRFTLGKNPGTNTVSVSAVGIEGTETFNALVEAPVDIPDANLRAVIKTALGKAKGDPITSSEMATLTRLEAQNANISDLTGLEHATNLRELSLWVNHISNLFPLMGLTRLEHLALGDNNITDISVVVDLTNLTGLHLGGNKVSDISPVGGLTRLTSLHLPGNNVSDASVIADLTRLTYLNLNSTNITDLSFLSGLTSLADLYLGWNNITDISVLSGLTNLTVLWLMDNNISNLSPLVANTGLGEGDRIDVSENPLSYQSINTHIPTLQRRGVEVIFENLKPTTSEYTLSIPVGTSLIHVPLKVTTVDDVEQPITSISDLYDALGGASTVIFLMTYDSQQDWLGYWEASDTGTSADRTLTDDTGIIAGMKAPVSLRLSGTPLGTNGRSTITLHPGQNLVGIPLRDSRITRVSDLFTLDGIGDNGPMVVVSDNGAFKIVARAGDDGDIPITGGQSFILTARQTATVAISGEAWTNVSEAAAAPLVTRKGIKVGDTTPVLGLRGSVVDKETGLKVDGFRITVKNLSTGRAVTGMTTDEGVRYRLTVVDIETGRAAMIGDTLEISVQSPNPFIGVKSLQYTVTAEDVRQSWIQLPALVAYEIPAETELLANYPNPFNPETWIPYRLAEDAFVALTIYDGAGQVVRTLDVGYQIAAIYENRSKAIYWDGRNEVGETVASDVYFYHLSAGDYSATRKMLIIK